jgi:hypothetical protein
MIAITNTILALKRAAIVIADLIWNFVESNWENENENWE